MILALLNLAILAFWCFIGYVILGLFPGAQLFAGFMVLCGIIFSLGAMLHRVGQRA